MNIHRWKYDLFCIDLVIIQALRTNQSIIQIGKKSRFNLIIIYLQLNDLKMWARLIWRYDPGWTDNAISARVSSYGSFTWAYIAYEKCVIFKVCNKYLNVFFLWTEIKRQIFVMYARYYFCSCKQHISMP